MMTRRQAGLPAPARRSRRRTSLCKVVLRPRGKVPSARQRSPASAQPLLLRGHAGREAEIHETQAERVGKAVREYRQPEIAAGDDIQETEQ